MNNKAMVLGLAVLGSLMAGARPEFVVSDRIYAVVGRECNIYFSQVFDSATPWTYAYEALCEKGRHELRRWCWTPKKEDAGTSQRLILRAINDTGLVAAATTTVFVAKEADKSKHVAMATLSASLVNCRYPQKTFRNLRKDGFTDFHAVGSCGKSGPEDVDGEVPKHDGYGGWTFSCFLTRYAMTETEFSKIQIEAERKQLESMGAVLAKDQEWRRGMSMSPFVRIENGKKVVDVQMWLDKVNAGKAPEVIIIYLGINGTFGPRDEKSLENMVDKHQIPNAKKLIATLRRSCPNTVIGLALPGPGTGQDAFADNYGCLQSAVQYRHNIFRFKRAYLKMAKELNDPRLFVFPASSAVDPEESFPKRESPAHARSARKVLRDSNAVHPSEAGGEQIADAVVAFLLNHWEEL